MKRYLGFIIWLALSSAFVYSMRLINTAQNSVLAGSAQAQVAGAATERDAFIVASNPVVQEINQSRDNDLVVDSRLNDVARQRRDDMLLNQYYGHEDLRGDTFAALLTQVGLPRTLYSCENLLMSDLADPASVVNEWLSSPAHQKCLSDPLMSRVGISDGLYDVETGQYLYVTVFAQL